MLKEMFNDLTIPSTFNTVVVARAFEDNSGALALANTQRLQRQTRYFNARWHHFWEHVNNGEVTIEKIDTTEQKADYLTKGLTREAFECIRLLVQRW